MDRYVLMTMIVVAGVVVFLLGREIVAWYFKTNTIIKNQEYQNEILKAIFKQLGGSVEEPEQKSN